MGGREDGTGGRGLQRPKLSAHLSWNDSRGRAGEGDERSSVLGGSGRDRGRGAFERQASSHAALPKLNAFQSDGSFLKGVERQAFLYGGAGETPREASKEVTSSSLRDRSEQVATVATGMSQEPDAEVAHSEVNGTAQAVFVAAPVAAQHVMGRIADIAAKEACAPAACAPAADYVAATGNEDCIDINKLAAKAFRAKLAGNMDEYERLQAVISGAPQMEAPAQPPAHLSSLSSGSKTIELSVAVDALGTIIGKAGAVIDALQQESGARVRVTQQPSADNPSERIILVTGTDDAISCATALIEQKLNDRAAQQAERGGRSLKAAVRKRKPDKEYESVPEFDPVTGQLKVVQKAVEKDEVEVLHEAKDGLSTKRPKKLQRYEVGSKSTERVSFFRGDEGKSLNDMVESERRGGERAPDANFADNIARQKKFKGITADDEYDYDEGVEMHDSRQSRQSDARRAKHAASAAANEASRQSIEESKAESRLNRAKHLVVALANHVYLRLQDLSPITPGHCVIEPIGQAASLVAASEEVAEETRNFQKCLIRMFEGRGQHVVFLESHVDGVSRGRASMSIECIPLDARDAKVASAYFRKAILESDEEWSQHKKLYETGGSIRGTVPPGFAYFAAGFGLQAGYAHVIENEAEWSRDFGRDILEGILEHPDTGIPLARRAKDDFAHITQKVTQFARAFDEFDWTKSL